MGDLNSVDVAFSQERRMVYGRPLPRQKVFQGIYIDDNLIFGVVLRNRVNDPGAADDTQIVAKTRSCYEKANLLVFEMLYPQHRFRSVGNRSVKHKGDLWSSGRMAASTPLASATSPIGTQLHEGSSPKSFVGFADPLFHVPQE